MTTEQQYSDEQYYQVLINSINQVSAMNSSSVFSVVKDNIKQKFDSFLAKKSNSAESIAKFNNLLYLFCTLGIATTDNKLLSKINVFLTEDKSSAYNKITIINKLLANIIYEQDQNRLNKQNYGLDLLHIVALKKAYLNWVRSIPVFSNNQQKVYIQKDKTIYSYKLAFSKQGYDLQPKKAKYLKSSLLWITAIIGIITAVSQGLIPAVLTTSLGVGLLGRLVIIGLPSIIMNIVLYKSMLQGLFKAFWKGHILTDKDGKPLSLTYKILSISSLIFSACSGFIAAVIAYFAAFEVLNLILAGVLSLSILGPLVTSMAIVIAAFTGISLASLFAKEIVDFLRDDPFTSFKKYFADIFYNNFKSDRNILLNIAKSLAMMVTAVLPIFLAGFLVVIEAAMQYSILLKVIPIPKLAVLSLVIASPAILVFTTMMFKNILEFIAAIPGIISNIITNIVNKYQNAGNLKSFLYNIFNSQHGQPSAINRFESIKKSIHSLLLVFFNALNSCGQALGVVDEMKEEQGRVVLNKFFINSDNVYTSISARITEFAETLATNNEGIDAVIVDIPATANVLVSDRIANRLS